MVQAGETVILLSADKAVSESTTESGRDCIVFSDDIGRGESSPEPGNRAMVVSPDLAVTASLVEPSGDLGLEILNTNSPVGETGTVLVTVGVSNDTAETLDGTITLDIAGGYKDSISVSVDSGESNEITLSWQTADGDAGDYTATVESGTDQATAPITVESVDNPEEITQRVKVTASGFDDVVGETDVLELIPQGEFDARFVRVGLEFSQEGPYHANNAGLGLQGGTEPASGDWESLDVRIRVGQNEDLDITATLDLGEVKTGGLYGVVDDGSGTFRAP